MNMNRRKKNQQKQINFIFDNDGKEFEQFLNSPNRKKILVTILEEIEETPP